MYAYMYACPSTDIRRWRIDFKISHRRSSTQISHKPVVLRYNENGFGSFWLVLLVVVGDFGWFPVLVTTIIRERLAEFERLAAFDLTSAYCSLRNETKRSETKRNQRNQTRFQTQIHINGNYHCLLTNADFA